MFKFSERNAWSYWEEDPWVSKVPNEPPVEPEKPQEQEWSRRQFLVGSAAIGVARVPLLWPPALPGENIHKSVLDRHDPVAVAFWSDSELPGARVHRPRHGPYRIAKVLFDAKAMRIISEGGTGNDRNNLT
jgi:hypothetical protein